MEFGIENCHMWIRLGSRKLLNDDYLAGMWRTDLPLGLLWVATRGGKAQRSARIPSWSWVSTDGPVHSGRRAPASVLQSVKVTLEVLEVHVDIPGIDPFGEVRTAYLNGRGRMHKAFRGAEKISKDSGGWPYATGEMPLLDSIGTDIGEVLFDDARLDQAPLGFDCLEICYGVTRYSNDSRCYFLVLTSTERIEEYKRIGAGYSARISQDSFDKDELRSFSLV